MSISDIKMKTPGQTAIRSQAGFSLLELVIVCAFLTIVLAYLSNAQIIFEGDVDGNGTVDSIQYRLLDSAGNSPPTGTCPCYIQRSQQPKDGVNDPLSQPNPSWSQELQNVVNSGVPGVDGSGNPLPYGGGLNISGNTAWGATNTSYYAAISSFK